MKLQYLVLAAIAASASAHSDAASYFDSLDVEDIKQYLKDSGNEAVDFGNMKVDQLKQLAVEQWNKNAVSKPWWKVWQSQDSYYDVAKLWVNENLEEPAKDWLFETWPRDALVKLLKSAGIKANANAGTDALVDQARRQYKKLTKKLGTSGNYPSDKFFDAWSDKDLQLWLDEFNIKYDKAKSSREDLVRKVKQHLRKATEYYQDERYELMSSLNVLNDEFEKTGNLNNVDFSTWSPKQIERWLNLHKVKLDHKMANSKDYLVDIAKKNKRLLNDDLEWLKHYAQKHASDILESGSEGAEKVWDVSKEKAQGVFDSLKESADDSVINDTFLVNVEYWPKDRLKEFLKARDIPYPYLSTRKHLVKLAKEHRNKPLRKLDEVMDGIHEWFDKWTIDDIQNWSRGKGQEVQDWSRGKGQEVQDWSRGKGQEVQDWSREKGQEAQASARSMANDAKGKAADVGGAINDKAGDVGDSIRSRAGDLGDAVRSKANDVGDAINDKAGDLSDSAKAKAKDFGDAVQRQSHHFGDSARAKVHDWTDSFDSWSADDLTKYLNSFGLRFPPSFSKDKLVALAKSHSRSFFGRPVTNEPYYLKYLPSKPRQWANYAYAYIFKR